jgi:hypothetical protein
MANWVDLVGLTGRPKMVQSDRSKPGPTPTAVPQILSPLTRSPPHARLQRQHRRLPPRPSSATSAAADHWRGSACSDLRESLLAPLGMTPSSSTTQNPSRGSGSSMRTQGSPVPAPTPLVYGPRTSASSSSSASPLACLRLPHTTTTICSPVSILSRWCGDADDGGAVVMMQPLLSTSSSTPAGRHHLQPRHRLQRPFFLLRLQHCELSPLHLSSFVMSWWL